MMAVKVDRQSIRGEQKLSAASSAADDMAEYFKGLAERGMGCTSNTVTLARTLGMNIGTARKAKAQLIETKRLKGSWNNWLSIDGVKFGQSVTDVLESLKIRLRRYFPLVVDTRVMDRPDRVPRGKATHLLVGEKRLTIDEASALADRLDQARKDHA